MPCHSLPFSVLQCTSFIFKTSGLTGKFESGIFADDDMAALAGLQTGRGYNVDVGPIWLNCALHTKRANAWTIGPLRLCCVPALIMEEFLWKLTKKRTPTVLDEHWATAQQTKLKGTLRLRSSSTAMRPSCVYVTWQQASRDRVSQPRFLTDGQGLEGGGHDHDHGQEPQPRIFIRKKFETPSKFEQQLVTWPQLSTFYSCFCHHFGRSVCFWCFDQPRIRSLRRQIRSGETFQRARLRERRERERERERGRDEERALKQGSACDTHVQPTFFLSFWTSRLSLGHWRRNGRDGGVSTYSTIVAVSVVFRVPVRETVWPIVVRDRATLFPWR